MAPETVITTAHQALELTIVLLLVLLIPALAVGLLVSMFQAATQINEMTLSFIPKLLAIFVMMVIAGPWMLNLLLDYMRGLFMNLPSMVG